MGPRRFAVRRWLACLCLVAAQHAVAEDLPPLHGTQGADATRERQEQGAASSDLALPNGLVIGGGATLVLLYGAHNWWSSGFGGGFDTTNEGWFGAATPFGGADKLGHVYSNYAGVRVLAPLFESVGNSREASVSLALWSTLGIYTAVEVIDGYSRAWKFSPQDALANVAGAALGYVLETHPGLDAVLDFRLDYRRSPGSRDFDPFGDYSAQKYLLVLKADGFASLRECGVLRYAEIAVGYGTRGYGSAGAHHRDAYVGISINLARLLADAVYDGRVHSTAFQRGADRLFELVQFPTVVYAHRTLE